MNLGTNMRTPERVKMAIEAANIQQRAEMEVLGSFADEGALLRETPEEIRERWNRNGGYKPEWCRRYRSARKRLTGLTGRKYADGIM